MSVRGAADPVHAVVSLRSLGQSDVSLVEVLATSQRHITHQQQPGAVCLTGLGVFQTGAVDGEHGKQKTTKDHVLLKLLLSLDFFVFVLRQ